MKSIREDIIPSVKNAIEYGIGQNTENCLRSELFFHIWDIVFDMIGDNVVDGIDSAIKNTLVK